MEKLVTLGQVVGTIQEVKKLDVRYLQHTLNAIRGLLGEIVDQSIGKVVLQEEGGDEIVNLITVVSDWMSPIVDEAIAKWANIQRKRTGYLWYCTYPAIARRRNYHFFRYVVVSRFREGKKFDVNHFQLVINSLKKMATPGAINLLCMLVERTPEGKGGDTHGILATAAAEFGSRGMPILESLLKVHKESRRWQDHLAKKATEIGGSAGICFLAELLKLQQSKGTDQSVTVEALVQIGGPEAACVLVDNDVEVGSSRILLPLLRQYASTNSASK